VAEHDETIDRLGSRESFKPRDQTDGIVIDIGVKTGEVIEVVEAGEGPSPRCMLERIAKTLPISGKLR